MKPLSIEFVCKVLKHYSLLDNELARYIALHEKEYRARLRKQSTSDKPLQITAVDIISAMQLHPVSTPEKVLSEELIMRTLALYWKLPFLKIDMSKLNSSALASETSEPFARKHLLVPVSISNKHLFVAIVNPTDTEALETMQGRSKLRVRPVISTKTDILHVIDVYYTASPQREEEEEYEFRETDTFQSLVNAAESELSDGTLYRSVVINAFTEEIPTDENIDAIVNLMLRYACEQRATEIHIDPKQFHSQVYFRIDGILYDVKRLSPKVHTNVSLLLKNQAGIGVFEKDTPQTGRISFTFHDRELGLRISTLPMTFGEKIIIRILDPLLLLRHMDDLGMSRGEFNSYRSLLSRPEGIVLIAGPLGSGKTTTLYSTLDALAEQGTTITTIETPIALPYDQFNQIEINPEKGFTFEAAIHTVSQYPVGVLMIGEIRDKATAESAVYASLFGHLVLSSLHTPDAPSAFARLIEMGMQPFLLESTVAGVIAQRLMRRVCRNCAQTYQLSQQEITALGSARDAVQTPSVQKGIGCAKCHETGYFGQTAIFEIMTITDEMRPLIKNNAGIYAIREAAIKSGMQPLRQRAIEKMREGITTCEEVLRVTGGVRVTKPQHFKTTAVLGTS